MSLLRPEEQVFDDMLTGWSSQQSSRMLNPKTIRIRLAQMRRFAEFCGSMPWEWTPVDVEDWTTELVSGDKPCSPSTIRSYQNTVSLFCDYVTDQRYGWADRCLDLFGTFPVQVCHEWNTVIHAGDHEARPAVRPLSRTEVQQFFDYADDRVDQARTRGKKGWKSVFRDSTLFKMIYAFGLRRREVAMLDLHDFTRNPSANEFGRFGALGQGLEGFTAPSAGSVGRVRLEPSGDRGIRHRGASLVRRHRYRDAMADRTPVEDLRQLHRDEVRRVP